MQRFRSIFANGHGIYTVWKLAIGAAVSASLMFTWKVSDDLYWLHAHRAEAPALMEAYRGDHYEIVQLKDAVKSLVESQKELTGEIRLEREERYRAGFPRK